jgi:acetyltransferase-like isoleucine patch superfamily enzyme
VGAQAALTDPANEACPESLGDSIPVVRDRLSNLVFLLPQSRLKNRLLNLLGHDIHPSVVIGICLVHRVVRFELAEGVRIGHFNHFAGMSLVKLGPGSRIVMFNSILGVSGLEPGAAPSRDLMTLRMGASSHIISSHYLDCGGGVVMADRSWITGIRSTILTHAFDPREGGVVLAPVTLKEGAVIATSCTMLPGTVVGEGALLAAGSTTWTGQELQAAHLHGGTPARRISAIEVPDSAYDRQGPLG